jgi:hypothetical protein
MKEFTAQNFITELSAFQTKKELENVQRYFRDEAGSKFLGVRMANIFTLAKSFTLMPLNEVAKLLGSEYYEVRMGVSEHHGLPGKDKKITAERKRNYLIYIFQNIIV